jgi:flap endonuclease-1
MLAAKQQGRLDGFFSVKPKDPAAASSSAAKGKAGTKAGDKRKADDKKGAPAKKGKK